MNAHQVVHDKIGWLSVAPTMAHTVNHFHWTVMKVELIVKIQWIILKFNLLHYNNFIYLT